MVFLIFVKLEYAVSLGKTSIADGTVKAVEPIADGGKIDQDVEMGINFSWMAQVIQKTIKGQLLPNEISGTMLFNTPGPGLKQAPFSHAGAGAVFHVN